MSARLVVIDASVGVKWFRNEAGTAEARDLLRQHAAGAVRLVVPMLFLFEVLDVARRHFGVEGARRVWRSLAADELVVSNPDYGLMDRSIDLAGRLGCTLYDAAAPALAEQLGCELVSADRRAHGAFPGVVLIG
ncbi:MAG: type II toxin-antitoxin system VapC family toxin [Anaerosomatales bacterium]|nr:type II toxin-antitoxin system VapC family toxin [Anaerosomatales bacterium]MDT8434796.1 type II toxin-antitoxin system VapC family toxin [Anaerosomatales bacterium]